MAYGLYATNVRSVSSVSNPPHALPQLMRRVPLGCGRAHPEDQQAGDDDGEEDHDADSISSICSSNGVQSYSAGLMMVQTALLSILISNPSGASFGIKWT